MRLVCKCVCCVCVCVFLCMCVCVSIVCVCVCACISMCVAVYRLYICTHGHGHTHTHMMCFLGYSAPRQFLCSFGTNFCVPLRRDLIMVEAAALQEIKQLLTQTLMSCSCIKQDVKELRQEVHLLKAEVVQLKEEAVARGRSSKKKQCDRTHQEPAPSDDEQEPAPGDNSMSEAIAIGLSLARQALQKSELCLPPPQLQRIRDAKDLLVDPVDGAAAGLAQQTAAAYDQVRFSMRDLKDAGLPFKPLKDAARVVREVLTLRLTATVPYNSEAVFRDNCNEVFNRNLAAEEADLNSQMNLARSSIVRLGADPVKFDEAVQAGLYLRPLLENEKTILYAAYHAAHRAAKRIRKRQVCVEIEEPVYGEGPPPKEPVFVHLGEPVDINMPEAMCSVAEQLLRCSFCGALGYCSRNEVGGLWCTACWQTHVRHAGCASDVSGDSIPAV